ncbi:MAG: type I-F CRISPR-associated protein Csy2 [Chlamydiales bacterium]|nr:type I-F CRISPR-associated protein Csy2 [Chlamydiales bacterium]
MKSLLILPRIKVDGANAISGLTYGFPAVTHFLGFAHSISRELSAKSKDINLGGCGIVCHHCQVHAHSIGRDKVFALSRNPLTKEGVTAPFNEEGKVSIEVSLIIECDFREEDLDAWGDLQQFLKSIYNLAVVRRLAGGLITEMSPPTFQHIPQTEDEEDNFYRRLRRKLLPGFILRDRGDIFSEYLKNNPKLDPLQALMDFYTIKSKSSLVGDKVQWSHVDKPSMGWLVPIQAGYKAISPLCESGSVSCARDPNTPFQFVEPIYGLGEWLSPHRITDIASVIWRYQKTQDLYICTNKFNKTT